MLFKKGHVPWNKGKKHSDESRKKMKGTHKGKKPFLGRHHSEKAKRKMREKHKGRIPWDKGKHLSEKHRKNIAKGKLGKKPSGETKRKMRESQIKFLTSGKAKFKDTKIELKIENELKHQGIPYMKQAPVESIAIVDFLLPNKVIIQVDGNYFHSRKINRGRDIAQDTILGFKGYKIYRFTETQINKSPKRCINKIFKIRGRVCA